MLERERLDSKKISKTNAVTSQLSEPVPAENVHVGPVHGSRGARTNGGVHPAESLPGHSRRARGNAERITRVMPV
ncbi:MAG TPA: hypothetical protein VNR00_03455 [Opitutus sp.]|nr:hypothetical protein [Opitutus sp.]